MHARGQNPPPEHELYTRHEICFHYSEFEHVNSLRCKTHKTKINATPITSKSRSMNVKV